MLETIITVDRLSQQIWVRQRRRSIVRWQVGMSPPKLDLGSRHLLYCSCPKSCEQGTCCQASPSPAPQYPRRKNQLQGGGPEGWGRIAAGCGVLSKFQNDENG